jgi:hypothetical protein
MWEAIKSLFGNIFSTPEKITQVVDSVVKTIDNASFTSQEKAEFENKKLDMLNDYLKTTTGQRIARRFLALVVGLVWFIVSISFLVALFLNLEVKADLFNFFNVVSATFGVVLSFYFEIWKKFQKD